MSAATGDRPILIELIERMRLTRPRRVRRAAPAASFVYAGGVRGVPAPARAAIWSPVRSGASLRRATVYLGIDAGSTTVKAVVMRRGRNRSSATELPAPTAAIPCRWSGEFLVTISTRLPRRRTSRGAASTGYGEELIKNAFRRRRRPGRDGRPLHGRQSISAPTSTSSSTSAGRTSSASRSATAPSTTSFSTRPALRAAARFLQTFASALGLLDRGLCPAGPVCQTARWTWARAARCL